MCQSLNADRVLANRWIYAVRPIRRDDIVVIKSDLRWCGDGALLVKRVIAIPGELVAVAGRSVWINGKWKGSAINHEGRRRAPYGKAVRIPSRHYFVVGDK